MKKPIFTLIPSGFKASKLYSILPNDGDGDFAFTRATVATRVQKNGLLAEVASNVPKIDWYNSDCPCLLSEPARTNRQAYSQEFDNAAYSKVRSTVTANDATAPDGSYTADLLVGDGTGTSYVFDNLSFVSGTSYAISIFVKKINVTSFVIQNFGNSGTATFDIENGTSSGVGGTFSSQSIQDYGNGWYRCIGIYTCSSTGSHNYGFGVQTFNGDQMHLWGAQVEEATYASSYIKNTTASDVTRNVDEALDAGSISLFSIQEGTMYLSVTPFKNTASFHTIGISSGADTSRVECQFTGASNQLKTIVQQGGSSSVDTDVALTFDTKNKIAVSFKANECKVYVNGSLLATDTSVDMPTALDEFNLSQFDSTKEFEGKVHDARIYDEVLTQAEAIELTTL